jgi:hypothetical protein
VVCVACEVPQATAGRARQEELRLRGAGGIELDLALARLHVDQRAQEALAVDLDRSSRDPGRYRP